MFTKITKIIEAPDEINTPRHKVTNAICSTCGGNFPIEDCETEQEGSYEEGYHDVHICPVCEDGGCIDDYC